MLKELCLECRNFKDYNGVAIDVLWDKKRFCACSLSPRQVGFKMEDTGWEWVVNAIDIDADEIPERCPWKLEHIVNRGK